MASVNKVILMGNLGRDPEVRYTADGMAVATLSLATSSIWKDHESGERCEATEWHRVVVFAGLAECVEQYLAKGKGVYVEGYLKTRKWTAKDGSERYSTEVVAEGIQFLPYQDRADRVPDSVQRSMGAATTDDPTPIMQSVETKVLEAEAIGA